jgi:hypothetical protein
VLHLSSQPPPNHLDALTSLPADTARSRALVFSYKVNHTILTPVSFYTGSAVPQLGTVNDQSHPLNPMRGFLGRPREHDREESDDDDEVESQRGEHQSKDTPGGSKNGYNLIYILDAIYHFPPSLPSFLGIALKALAPGGVIAYIDIVPPPSGLNALSARLLSAAFGVPVPNLTDRPRDLTGHKTLLEGLGYVDVDVRDWSAVVWPGFAKNLLDRGGAWTMVGHSVRWANEAGWRCLAVRAKRPET